MGVQSRLTPAVQSEYVDARRHRRFKFEAEIRIYPRNSEVVQGHTVDISESGISAMVRDEIPLNEVVRLDFSVPLGHIEVYALVRYQNAFRLGFQFVDATSVQDIIERTCRQLAVEESLKTPLPENLS